MTNLPSTRALPRVPGTFFLGNLSDFRDRRIELQHRVARDHGEFVRLRLGFIPILLASSPELAHAILVENEDAFVKSHGLALFARPLLGDGLLTSEHAAHRQRRKRMAPAFTPARVASYAGSMVERAERAAERMLSLGECDLAEESMRATLDIVGKTLFDADLVDDASEVGSALTDAMERMMASFIAFPPTPPAIPTPNNRKLRAAVARLDRIVYGLVRDRRVEGRDRRDVLSILLAEDAGGTRMTDVEVRDEAMTLFLAGHETTAAAVAWAMLLLAKHPDVRIALEQELDDVLGDRPLTHDDLAGLRITEAVLEETMRLYPPAYFLGRRAIREVDVGGYRVRRNQVVLINVAGIHRNERVWDAPESFEPARFDPVRRKAIPRYAYLPFGAGSRICIGSQFAMMEGKILLATLVRRLVVTIDPDARLEEEPLLTLRPKPVRARIEPRSMALARGREDGRTTCG